MEVINKKTIRELNKLRKEKKITAYRVAMNMGLSPSRIYNIEKSQNDIHINTLIDYLDAIGMKMIIVDKDYND